MKWIAYIGSIILGAYLAVVPMGTYLLWQTKHAPLPDNGVYVLVVYEQTFRTAPIAILNFANRIDCEVGKKAAVGEEGNDHAFVCVPVDCPTGQAAI
jgi:hypothetical protein